MFLAILQLIFILLNEIGAVTKIVVTRLASLQLSQSLFKQVLITVHHMPKLVLKTSMSDSIPLTSSLLLNYRVKKYIHIL